MKRLIIILISILLLSTMMVVNQATADDVLAPGVPITEQGYPGLNHTYSQSSYQTYQGYKQDQLDSLSDESLNVDVDGDGFTKMQEYLAGSSDADAGSTPQTIHLNSLAPGAANASPELPYLRPAAEVRFTLELAALARELNYDPVQIFNYVSQNIALESYELSRKGSQATFLTKRGNSWDQCTLLITLLRLSGIPARYGIVTSEDPQLGARPYVQAWASANLYRGIGQSTQNEWVTLVPYYRVQNREGGIGFIKKVVVGQDTSYELPTELDLFNSDGKLDDKDVSFEEYLKEAGAETAVEELEEVIRDYLAANHPELSLNQTAVLSRVREMDNSILPSTYPRDMDWSGDHVFAESIPDEYQVRVRIRLYPKLGGTEAQPLIDYVAVLPAIAGHRLAVDYKFATTADQEAIEGTLGDGNITDPVADGNLKVLLLLDGVTIDGGEASDAPISTASSVIPMIDSYVDAQAPATVSTGERPSKRVGTILIFGFDPLAASVESVAKYKSELIGLSKDLIDDDTTREQYWGRFGAVIVESFLLRSRANSLRVTELLNIEEQFPADALSPTILYAYPKVTGADTDPDHVFSDDESAFTVHPVWRMDALRWFGELVADIPENPSTGWPYPLAALSTPAAIDIGGPVGRFYTNLIGYTESLNESLAFDTWQQTNAISTINGIKSAYENDIAVVTLTTADIIDNDLPILRKQTENQIDDEVIDEIIAELKAGTTVVTPITKVAVGDEEEKLEGNVRITQDAGGQGFAPDYIGLFVDRDHGVISGIRDAGSGPSLPNMALDNPEAAASTLAEPVDIVRGDYIHDELADIAIRGRGFPLSLKRMYRSQAEYDGPFGYGWTWNHSEHITYETNGDLTFYQADQLPRPAIKNGTEYIYPAGTTYVITTESIDGADHYVITHKDGMKLYFKIDAVDKVGRLVKKEDRNGNTLTFEYDQDDRMIKIVDTLNRTIEFTYDDNPANNIDDDKIVTATDFIGRSCTYNYDDKDLVSCTDLQGNICTYEYLENQENEVNNHNMSQAAFPNGDYIKIYYYKNDTVSHHTNSKNESFHFQYSPINRFSETWNEIGYYRKIFWDENFNVIRAMDEEKTLYTVTYDEHHNALSVTDGRGSITKMQYDEHRNIISRTNPVGSRWAYEYSGNYNQIVKTTDPRGVQAVYEYDANGNLLSHIQAFGLVEEVKLTYEYDDFGNNISIINQQGGITKSVYDPSGLNVIEKIDAKGNRSLAQYNAVGQMTKSVDVLGAVQTFEYDQYNQVTRQVDALGNITKLEYDVMRRLARRTDARGNATTYKYDVVRDRRQPANLIEEIDSFGFSTKFVYDARGRRVAVTDKNGNTTLTRYDGLDRPVEVIDPLAQLQNDIAPKNSAEMIAALTDLVQRPDERAHTVITRYDAAGNTIERIDKRGNSTYYTYDKANRLLEVRKSVDGEDRVTRYEYDSVNNMTKRIDGAGSGSEIVYVTEYDALNRPVKEIAGFAAVDGEDNDISRTIRYEYDSLGRVHREYSAIGYIESSYDANGNKVRQRTFDKHGILQREQSWVVDSKNRVLSMTDPNENTTTYEYDLLDRKVKETNARGHSSKMAYDAGGNLISSSDRLGNEVQHKYNERNERVVSIDPEGGVVTVKYDPNGNPVSVTDQAGFEKVTAYDALNRVSGERDAAGNWTLFEYDGNGKVLATINAQGHRIVNSYNEMGELTSMTNPLGHTETYTYDQRGRRVSLIDARSYTTEWTYNIFNDVLKVIDALDQETVNRYDSVGRLVETTDPRGIKFQQEFNAAGFVSKKVAAVGTPQEIVATYEHDAGGRVTKMTSDAGGADQVVTYSYDEASNLIQTVQFGDGGLQVKNASIYDAGNRVIEERGPRYFDDDSLDFVQYQYNATGQRTKILPLGRSDLETTYTYDLRRKLAKVALPEGEEIEYEYDAVGRRTIIKQKNDSQQYESSTIVYDSLGRILEEVDFNGVRTTFAYDAAGQLVRKTSAALLADTAVVDERSITEYEYDENGNVLEIYDGNRFDYGATPATDQRQVSAVPSVRYQYDELNRQEQVKDADGTYRDVVSFDANGNPTVIKLRDGALVRRTFDSLNRVTKIEVDENTSTYVTSQEFTYDKLSRMTKAVDHNVIAGSQTHTYTVDFTYDQLNRVTSEDQSGRGASYAVDKVYDKSSNQIELTYPGSNERIVKMTYDARGRLDVIKDIEDSTAPTAELQVADYDYDKNSRVSSVKYGDQVTPAPPKLELTYDARGREDSRTYTFATGTPNKIFGQTTAYDAQSNVTDDDFEFLGPVNTVPSVSRDFTFEYDKLHRVTKRTEAATSVPEETWDYDAVGNWTGTNQNQTDEVRSVNDDNEYDPIDHDNDPGTPAITTTYDDRGNLTAYGDRTFVYDWRNRLVEVKESGTTVETYRYDGLDRRVSRRDHDSMGTPGTHARFIYDDSRIIEEHDVDDPDATTPTTLARRQFVYGVYVDEPVMFDANGPTPGQRYFYAHDRQYNVRALFDSSGDIKEGYEYSTFGVMTVHLPGPDTNWGGGDDVEQSSSSLGNPYGYTGRYWDDAVGLWQYRNRVYDPQLGRFLQRDPAGYVDGMNLYAYGVNNPSVFRDPSGTSVIRNFFSGIVNAVGSVFNWIGGLFGGGSAGAGRAPTDIEVAVRNTSAGNFATGRVSLPLAAIVTSVFGVTEPRADDGVTTPSDGQTPAQASVNITPLNSKFGNGKIAVTLTEDGSYNKVYRDDDGRHYTAIPWTRHNAWVYSGDQGGGYTGTDSSGRKYIFVIQDESLGLPDTTVVDNEVPRSTARVQEPGEHLALGNRISAVAQSILGDLGHEFKKVGAAQNASAVEKGVAFWKGVENGADPVEIATALTLDPSAVPKAIEIVEFLYVEWDNLDPDTRTQLQAQVGILLAATAMDAADVAAGVGKIGVKSAKAAADRVIEQALSKKAMKALPEPSVPASKVAPDVSAPDGCFIAGTVVHAVQGVLTIESVSAGTEVWACAPETGEWCLKRVVAPLSHHYEGDVITITIDGAHDSIEATGNHPFWVVEGEVLSSRPVACDVYEKERHSESNGRWVEARSLRNGDVLLLQSGQVAKIVKLTIRHDRLKVYNIEVEDFHTYAVGVFGVLVHNKARKYEPEKMAQTNKPIPSIKSRLKNARLPIEGLIRFVPKKGYNPSVPLPRGPQHGFLDRFGNEWVPGPSRTEGQPFEWDVQLSERGRAQIGHLSRDGKHVNVSLDGRITHR